MIRIAITAAAFDAFCATLPLGSVSYEAKTNAKGAARARRELRRRDRAGGGGARV
jgi:hypothetical protein